MTSQWQPYREHLTTTIRRTSIIAIVIGFILAQWWGGLSRWPATTLSALWPSLGGHWVEVWFLNWLRPRLSSARVIQVTARLSVWFIGGIALVSGMQLTATWLAGFQPSRWQTWWLAGLAFIGVELVAHVALLFRGRPSFYDGRG